MFEIYTWFNCLLFIYSLFIYVYACGHMYVGQSKTC